MGKLINNLTIPRDKMSIDQHCLEGNIPAEEFIDFLSGHEPMDPNKVKRGDYLVSPPGWTGKGGLRTEEVKVVGHIESGDFLTKGGTTGPISGNIFLRLVPEADPLLLMGGTVYGGPGSVHEYLGMYPRVVMKK